MTVQRATPDPKKTDAPLELAPPAIPLDLPKGIQETPFAGVAAPVTFQRFFHLAVLANPGIAKRLGMHFGHVDLSYDSKKPLEMRGIIDVSSALIFQSAQRPRATAGIGTLNLVWQSYSPVVF